MLVAAVLLGRIRDAAEVDPLAVVAAAALRVGGLAVGYGALAGFGTVETIPAVDALGSLGLLVGAAAYIYRTWT